MENNRLTLLSSLLLFRQEKESLLCALCADSTDSTALSRMISCASENRWSGNLWHCLLAQALIESENPFSLHCERRGAANDSLFQIALRDAGILVGLFAAVPEEAPWDILRDFHREDAAKSRVAVLAKELAEAESAQTLLHRLTRFYADFGVGAFGLYETFRVGAARDGCALLPIMDRREVWLSDLVGYETQKKQLLENTKSFVSGGHANNVLLYGDAGTGKSSSVQAIAGEFAREGLRVIEIYPQQYPLLPALLEQLKKRNYRFILLLDDLSFEENETSYKYLKAMLEGGAEASAENVRIYATSNRRHLVRENWNDRTDMEHNGDIHRSDTVEEKLSLASRFGLQIFYGAPTFEEYQKIVSSLYKNNPNSARLTDEQLRSAAATWQVRSGSRSGRTARQFVDALLSQDGNR